MYQRPSRSTMAVNSLRMTHSTAALLSRSERRDMSVSKHLAEERASRGMDHDSALDETEVRDADNASTWIRKHRSEGGSVVNPPHVSNGPGSSLLPQRYRAIHGRSAAQRQP